MNNLKKIRLCVYLTIRFTKTQPFYLDFIKPNFASPCNIRQYTTIAEKRRQKGRNIFYPLFLFLIEVLVQDFANDILHKFVLTYSVLDIFCARVCHISG